jgi:hypothetical protein
VSPSEMPALEGEAEGSQRKVGIRRAGGKIWERIKSTASGGSGETDYAYEAFKQYLNLRKRGPQNRRFQQDLARLRGVQISAIHRLYIDWNWEERATAYDEYFFSSATNSDNGEASNDFAEELDRVGRKLFDKAAYFLQNVVIDNLEDATKIAKLTVDLCKAAKALKESDGDGDRKKILDRIKAKEASIGERANRPGPDDHGTTADLREGVDSAGSGIRTAEIDEGTGFSIQTLSGQDSEICQRDTGEKLES